MSRFEFNDDNQKYTTEQEVEYFKNRCPIGAELNCMVFEGPDDARTSTEVQTKCRILHKGRHTAVTDKGTMQWTLLTVWNRPALREWQYMDKKYKEIKGGIGR